MAGRLNKGSPLDKKIVAPTVTPKKVVKKSKFKKALGL